MRSPVFAVLLAVAWCLALPSAVSADAGVAVTFTSDEVRIIASWYEEHGRSSVDKGRGKGRDGGLPPGIAKNLARGKTLPPGIAKQYLPEGLVRALPAPPRGYERIIVDGRILLVEVATRVIHDVLTDLVVK